MQSSRSLPSDCTIHGPSYDPLCSVKQGKPEMSASYLRQFLLVGPALLCCARHRFDCLRRGMQACRDHTGIGTAWSRQSITRLVGKQDLLGEEPIEYLRVAHVVQAVRCLSRLLEPAMHMAMDCVTTLPPSCASTQIAQQVVS